MTKLLQRAPGGPAAAAPPVAGSTLDIVTAAQNYTSAYFSGARAGLNDAENALQDDASWAAFWANVAGNVLWATACFVTDGGAAAAFSQASKQFAVSIAGISLSTSAAASTMTSKTKFHEQASNVINEVWKKANASIGPVTQEVESRAKTDSWDDNKTRHELLRRLFKPEYISTDGVANLDQPKVAASVERELILRANRETPGVVLGPQGADIIYRYHLDNYWEKASGFWGFVGMHHKMKPLGDWKITPGGQGLAFFPTGGTAAAERLNAIYSTFYKGEPMKISTWPVRKTITMGYITLASRNSNWVEVNLDDKNQFESASFDGEIFKEYFEQTGVDRNEFARQILARVWGSTGNLPPDVPQLSQAGGWGPGGD